MRNRAARLHDRSKQSDQGHNHHNGADAECAPATGQQNETQNPDVSQRVKKQSGREARRDLRSGALQVNRRRSHQRRDNREPIGKLHAQIQVSIPTIDRNRNSAKYIARKAGESTRKAVGKTGKSGGSNRAPGQKGSDQNQNRPTPDRGRKGGFHGAQFNTKFFS